MVNKHLKEALKHHVKILFERKPLKKTSIGFIFFLLLGIFSVVKKIVWNPKKKKNVVHGNCEVIGLFMRTSDLSL